MNPLTWLRNNQQRMLVFFTVLLMAGFGIGGVFMSSNDIAPTETVVPKPVVKWTGGTLTDVELDRMWYRRSATQLFASELIQATRSIQSNFEPTESLFFGDGVLSADSPSAVRRQESFNVLLFAQKAEDLGVLVSDDTVDQKLSRFTGNLLTENDMRSIAEQVGRRAGNLSYVDFRDVLKTEFLAMQTYVIGLESGVPNQVNPATALQYYSRMNQEIECQVLPFAVDDFLAKVSGEASDAELRAIYEKGKHANPSFDAKEPGFRVGNRLKLQYFSADISSLVEKFKQELTAEQVQSEYDRLVKEKDPLVFEAAVNDQNQDLSGGLPTLPGTANPPGAAVSPAEQNNPAGDENSVEMTDPAATNPNSTPENPGNLDLPPAVPGTGEVPGAGEVPASDPPGGGDVPESNEPKTDKPPSPDGGNVSVSGANSASDFAVLRGKFGQDEVHALQSDGQQRDGQQRDGRPANVSSSRVYTRLESAAAQEPAAQEPASESPAAEGLAAEGSAVTAEQDADGQAAPATGLEIGATQEPSDPNSVDAGAQDAAAQDAGAQDAGAQDAATQDAGAQDAGAQDAGAQDAATQDAGNNADGEKKEDKIRPLTEVQEEIKTRLAQPKAFEAVEEAFKKIERELQIYRADLRVYEASPDSEPQPTALDFKALAAKHGLNFSESPVMDQRMFDQTQMGKVRFQQQGSFSQLLFSSFENLELYDPTPVTSDVRVWVSEKYEAHIAEFDEVREQVLEFWKRNQAIELATKEAQAKIEVVNQSPEPMKTKFSEAIETGSFSWFSTDMMTRSMTYGQPVGVRNPGEDFMRTAFGLELNAAGVAANADRTIVYAIQKTALSGKDQGERKKDFFAAMSAFRSYPFQVGQVFNTRINEARVNFITQIRDDYEVKMLE